MIPELIRDCVHCGFCLPTCPTYLLWREEPDSPRGRIWLMDAGTLDATSVEHFDRCLGCMACVSACPSGVRYDRLIEATREAVEREYERPRGQRALRALLFAVLPHRRRLRAALALAPLGRALPLPAALEPLVELAPRRRSAERPPERTPGARGRVSLLLGCVQSVVFGDVNAATARALAAEGWEVAAPREQGCCGALALHAGRVEQGRRLAAELPFDGTIAVNAAGCGSHLKDAGRDARDASELLDGSAALHPLELTVAYQDSCHLRHAQGLPAAWRPLLERIPGLSVVEPAEQDVCCGSAGLYNLTQPQAARGLGDRKAAHLLATGATAYASANPGCLVQVSAALRRAGRPLPAFHPVELYDAAIRGVPAEALLRTARR